MSKPPLHFSHANSFPAGSYRRLFDQLANDYRLGYIDMLGHDPAYPVSDGWPTLVAQSIQYIEQSYTQPVIAVGHSLGGFLSFMAALQRPELFRALIVLDAPIFNRFVSSVVWLGKQLGFIDRITPGRGAIGRRRHWESQAAALQHFSRRSQFARFDPQCLRDYVEAGTVPVADGVALRFDPAIEYRIYCALPHCFPRYRGRLQVPAGFIGGRESPYIREGELQHMQRHFGMVVDWAPGGHLFPLEQPDAAALAVRQMIARLCP